MSSPGHMTLSLVVASYNRARMLPGFLDCLERQTLPPEHFEVIVVDDGSAEPVRAVLESRPSAIPIRLIEQSNTGQAGARHRGIQEASGEIIVIVDDDMELAPDLLEAHRRWHEQGYRVVLGRIHPARGLSGMPLFERFHARQLEKMAERFRLGDKPHGVHLCTGNVSFRRADYFAIGGFDRELKRSEDRDLGIRFESAGATFVYAEDAGTGHESDHTSLEVWLNRAYRYGIYDTRIHAKHPDVASSNPWQFLFLVHPLTRPLLLLTTAAPSLGKRLSRVVFDLAEWLDGKGQEGLALRATTIVYGLEYFRGMRDEAGSLGGSVENLAAYLRERRRTLRV